MTMCFHISMTGAVSPRDTEAASDTMTCAVCHKCASNDIVTGTKIHFLSKIMQNVRDMAQWLVNVL